MSYTSPSQISKIKEHLESVPVSLNNIAFDLGIAVYKAKLPNGVSGKLMSNELLPNVKGGESGWTVLVNADESPLRQRFTLAHEIGHFCLHLNLIDNKVVDDTYYRSEQISNYKESEANRFAADLLMPWDKIKEYMDDLKIKSVDQLAEVFQVSVVAMSVRLGVES